MTRKLKSRLRQHNLQCILESTFAVRKTRVEAILGSLRSYCGDAEDNVV